jgi:hypothetical protein
MELAAEVAAIEVGRASWEIGELAFFFAEFVQDSFGEGFDQPVFFGGADAVGDTDNEGAVYHAGGGGSGAIGGADYFYWGLGGHDGWEVVRTAYCVIFWFTAEAQSAQRF